MEDILGIIFLFGGGTLFLLAVSPVGRAIADRIRKGGASAPRQELDRMEESHLALYDEVEALRQDLQEVREQLDFTERMLARQREVGRLEVDGEDHQ